MMRFAQPCLPSPETLGCAPMHNLAPSLMAAGAFSCSLTCAKLGCFVQGRWHPIAQSGILPPT